MDGMNFPQEKGTKVLVRRTGQCSRIEKITEMPSWIFCNIDLVNTALHPYLLPISSPYMYIYLLCCILLLWFKTQFWVWLHFWVAPVMYFIGIYIYEYKSNALEANVKIQFQGNDVWIFFYFLGKDIFWLCLSRAVAMYMVAEPRTFYTNRQNLDCFTHIHTHRAIFLHTELGTSTLQNISQGT